MDSFEIQQESLVRTLDNRLVTTLEKLSEVFRIMLWDHAKKTGLSPIQIQILVFIRQHKEPLRRVAHLAREFNMTKATISDAVKVLEEKGLISKSVDPDDARSQVLKLTVTGSKMAADLSSFDEPLLVQIRKMDPETKVEYYESTLTLIQQLVNAGTLNQQRMCYSCMYFEPGKEVSKCSFLKLELGRGELKNDCAVFAGIKK